jgi:carbonic anhydrase
VWESIADILRGSEELRRRVREGKLMIVGAVYDLKTGQVRWLGVHPRQSALSHEVTP